jgi:flagellar biosynthesis/type III secretory pathway chaperone
MENKKQEHNYINILIGSLDKKINILTHILEMNEKQKSVITLDKFDEEEFDEIYSQKGRLISELNLLDNGFESVYQRVSVELKDNPLTYAEEIHVMQDMVKKITELSMSVELSEKRNKELMDKKTDSMKSEVKTAKASNKAAMGYYQTMNRLNIIDPQFMDHKK